MTSVLICGGLLHAKDGEDVARTVVNANICPHAKGFV